MYENHPDFDIPPDDTVLWRYMDFTKFVSLLERKALFFCSAFHLGDPFEGSISPATSPVTPGDLPITGPVEEQQFDLRQVALTTYVNCWHASMFESEAMWRLYAKERDGVAIKTTFESFKGALIGDQSIYASKIRYIDYRSSKIPFGNYFYPLLHKRISFEHEKEVRALFQSVTNDGRAIPNGIYCEVDLERLANEIVVAPFAPEWFVELVRSLAERYGIGNRVRASSLSGVPEFKVRLLAPRN